MPTHTHTHTYFTPTARTVDSGTEKEKGLGTCT